MNFHINWKLIYLNKAITIDVNYIDDVERNCVKVLN